MNAPKLRFPEFTGEWQQCKLGDIGSVSMCKRIFKEQTTENGDIPFYKIGTFGGKADAYISKDLFEEYKAKYPFPKIGDILISASGSIGRTVEFNGENAYFQDSNIVWLNHDERVDNSFLKQFYSIVKWSGLEGSAIKRLYNSNILKTEISLPSLPEQQKIASLFTELDTLIQSAEKELEGYRELKQGMLQKMFPKKGEKVPEVRFPEFTGDWEERKLSELATMHARIGWQNLRTSEFLDTGNYMLITGTDFEDGRVNYSTCHYVEKERYDQDKNIQIKNGSILITKDGTLGKVAYVEGLNMPATLNAGVFNIEVRDENETDGKYLFQFLRAPFLMNYVAQKVAGSTIKHLNQNILVDFPISIPSKEEQKKIGEYFSNLDNLITLQQKEIDGYKELKKGLLQQMFC